MAKEPEPRTTFTCHECQCHTKDTFVCCDVTCMKILCGACADIHPHLEDILTSEKSYDAVKPFIEKNRKMIKDRLVKTLSRRAKSGLETGSRLDKTAEIKRDIKSWCSQMREIIDEVENKLIDSVEAMENDFETDASLSMKELHNLEADYKTFHELQSLHTSNQCSSKQSFQLFALMKKYENVLDNTVKNTDKKFWEQTYLSFIPDEKCLSQLRSVSYDCGRIKSNIQLSIDTREDKSSSGLCGMTMIGGRIAVADKFNRCVKTFTCPSRCGLGGEAVDYDVINSYYDEKQSYSFTTPVDLVHDKETNQLLVADEQDNCVLAIDANDQRLHWKLEMKRPNGVAITSKFIVVCSEYEKYLMTFKRPSNKKGNVSLLTDHPLSIAINKNDDIAMCTLHGKMVILNSDLKPQHEVPATIDGTAFLPQRVSSLHNDRFLACDTHRVVEIQPDGVPKRTLLIAGMPGTSIPELPRAVMADRRWDIYLGFGKYVKMFPVPMEILPGDKGSETSSDGRSSEGPSSVAVEFGTSSLTSVD